MNKKLRFTALALGTCLIVSTGAFLAGCGENDLDPKPTPTPTVKKITDGIFDGSIGTNSAFIRFHEKDEVVEGKSIFYAQFVSNALAGYYTVEEKAYDYTGSWATKDDFNERETHPEKALSGSSKYTVTLTSFSGDNYGVIGYEDGKLYNVKIDHTFASMGFSAGYIYNQKDDNNKEETGVTLYSFVDTANEDHTLQILHNGSYIDGVSFTSDVTGTWKVSADGSVYTLTPDEDSVSDGAKGGTFTLNADGLSGTLAVDGKNFALGQPKQEGKPFMTFSGEKKDVDMGYGMKADFEVTADLLSNLDMTLTITSIMTVSGNKVRTPLELTGTYTVDENGTPKTFTVSGEQTVQSATGGEPTKVPVNIEGTFVKAASGEITFAFTYNNIEFNLTGKYAERVYVTFSGEKKDVDMGYGMKADFTLEAKLLDDLTMTLVQTSIMTISDNEVKTPIELTGKYTVDENGIPKTFAVTGKTAVQNPTDSSITMQDVNINGTFTASANGITLSYEYNSISFTAAGAYEKQATGFVFSLATKLQVPQVGEQDAKISVILFDDDTAIMLVDYVTAYIPDQVFTGSYEMDNIMPSSVTVGILGVNYIGTVAMVHPNLNLTFDIAAFGGNIVLTYELPAAE